MDRLKDLLIDQRKAFEQFKRRNDARLAAIEENGKADPLLEESVRKANDDIARLNRQITDLSLKSQLPYGNGSGNQSMSTKGFDKFLRKGDTSEMEMKSLSTGTDADGGYAVPEQLDNNLNNYMFDANVMRQIASTQSAYSSNYSKAINTGGIAAGWVGETSARPETATPNIEAVEAPTGELYCNPAATQWMIEDYSYNLEQWLMGEVRGKFSSMEGDAFINGDGTNKPKGFLAYTSSTTDDDSRAFGVLKHKVAAAATALTCDELIDLTLDLRGVYRRGGVWLMNSKTAGKIRMLKDSTGNYIWQNNIQLGAPNLLLGSGVYIDESMPDVAADDVPIAYGNFKLGYEIVDRTPLRVLRDPYTNKPFVHFYCTKRVSGMLVDSNAIRLFKMAAE